MYANLLRGLQVKYVIDLTAGDGSAALACYKLRIVNLGVTLTKARTQHLSAKFEHDILQAIAYGAKLGSSSRRRSTGRQLESQAESQKKTSTQKTRLGFTCTARNRRRRHALALVAELCA